MIRRTTVLLGVAGFFALAGWVGASACGQKPGPPDPVADPQPQAPAAEEKPRFDPSESDAEAILLVERLWEKMGGKEAYDRIDFISLTFQVNRGEVTASSRDLIWDRRAGRLRAYLKTSRGELVVLVDLENSTGVARENGEPVPEADVAGVVQYVRDNFFRNDVFWVVGPWRLKDPGVHLRMAGDVEREGKRFKRIKVTFDDFVRFAPAGEYWLLIDPKTGLLAEWGFRLAGAPQSQSPTWFTWEEWIEKGGVKFSTVRNQVGGDQRISCLKLETPSVLAPDLFEGL